MKKVKKMKLGSYLVKNGFLTLDQAKEVIAAQQGGQGVSKERFGRIAIKLGYISEKMLNRVVMQKEKQEFGF
jgi:hypothetical protein